MEVSKKAAKVWPLLKKLSTDYPDLKFVTGRKFMFRPPRTIVIEQKIFEQENSTKTKVDGADDPCKIEQNFYDMRLLHEVGHALLEHRNCSSEHDRIKKERSAWEKAQALSYIYSVPYDKDFVEAELDTYRDWLERKMRCPECEAAQYVDNKGKRHCPACELG